MVWYGEPGGVTLGIRLRNNYQGWVNRTQLGVAVTSRQPDEPPNPVFTDLHVRHIDPFDRLQVWATADDVRLPWNQRPVIGLHLGAWAVDGVLKLDARKSWDVSRFLLAAGPRRSLSLEFSGAYPMVHSMLDSTRWSGLSTNELTAAVRVAPPARQRFWTDGELTGSAGYQSGRADRDFERDWYARVAATGRLRATWLGARAPTLLRAMAAVARQTPVERAILSGAQNSIAAFSNHWYRPANGLLSRPSVNFVPLGGTGFRWGDPFAVIDAAVVVLNAEQDLDVLRMGPPARPLWISVNGWMDVAASRAHAGDPGAGLGVVARGYLFDRVIRLRVDTPLWTSGTAGLGESVRFSFSDLW
jgi:hypothetical protein